MDPRVRTWQAAKADMEAVKGVLLESSKAQQRKAALHAPAFSTLGSLVVEEGGCTPAGDGERRLQLPIEALSALVTPDKLPCSVWLPKLSLSLLRHSLACGTSHPQHPLAPATPLLPS